MFTNQMNILKRVFSKSPLALFLTAGILSSCEKEDHDHDHNDNELITTVTLTMREVNSTNVVTATFRDPDGEGGAAPSKFDEIVLKPNTVYNTSITIADESKNPPMDITAEIEEEAANHQFFFTPKGGLNLSVAYDDKDKNNMPLGLKTKITSGAASTGMLQVTLKHLSGNKNNNISTGETDIELDFITRIQP